MRRDYKSGLSRRVADRFLAGIQRLSGVGKLRPYVGRQFGWGVDAVFPEQGDNPATEISGVLRKLCLFEVEHVLFDQQLLCFALPRVVETAVDTARLPRLSALASVEEERDGIVFVASSSHTGVPRVRPRARGLKWRGVATPAA